MPMPSRLKNQRVFKIIVARHVGTIAVKGSSDWPHLKNAIPVTIFNSQRGIGGAVGDSMLDQFQRHIPPFAFEEFVVVGLACAGSQHASEANKRVNSLHWIMISDILMVQFV